MKAGWQIKKLRDVCTLINGRAYKKSELLSEGKYPVLRVGNFFTNNHWYYSDLELDGNKYCDSGDLLYAWSASFGPRIWDGGKVIFHYHIWKVIPDAHQIDQSFLFHFFLWDMEQIKKDRGAGTTMLHVSKGSMEDRDILLPPLTEQQRIVAILDEAFDGISKARANAEKNLHNARELFDSYLQSIFILRADGWKEKRLGSIAEVQSGGTPLVSNKDFWNGDIAWYSSGELNNRYTSDPERKITTNGLKGSNAKLFPAGSLLIGMYDTAALKMSILDRDAAFNQAVAGVRPNGEIDLTFILHAINAKKPILLSQRRGVRQKNLSLSKIKDITFNMPQRPEQEAVVARLDAYAVEIQHLESLYQAKIEALNELKKSLLHQAFRGKL